MKKKLNDINVPIKIELKNVVVETDKPLFPGDPTKFYSFYIYINGRRDEPIKHVTAAKSIEELKKKFVQNDIKITR